MDTRKNKQATFHIIILFSLLRQLPAQPNPSYNSSPRVANEIQVGVILDMGTWLGKTLHSCIAVAISDFYAINNGYQTRIYCHSHQGFQGRSNACSLNWEAEVIKSLQWALGLKSYVPKSRKLSNECDKKKKKKRELRVGFWTRSNGIEKEIYPSSNGINPSSGGDVDKIMWPGMSGITPKGWLMRKSSEKLRIAVPQKLHFKELVNIDYGNLTNDVTITGFCIDVFKAAIEALPYEVEYEFIPFIGNYYDLIYQVYLKNFDAAVGDITITAKISQYVDFTMSYTDLGVGTIERIGNKDMWIFLKPLDADLWLTSLAFFLFRGIVVWVIEHPTNSEFHGSSAQQIGKICRFTFSTLVLNCSYYTATESSFLTVQQIQGASKGDPIGYHSEDPVTIFHWVHHRDHKLWSYVSPEEFADALSRGSQNGGAAAIIDEIPYIKTFLAKYSTNYAMAFQKGSQLVFEISRRIVKQREGGKLMMIEKKWFKSHKSTIIKYQNSLTNSRTLSLDSVWGLFIITGVSFALALLWFKIYFLHEYLQLDILRLVLSHSPVFDSLEVRVAVALLQRGGFDVGEEERKRWMVMGKREKGMEEAATSAPTPARPEGLSVMKNDVLDGD
ncbi:hypothetical protein LguiA_011818 [Lonicera macranthoides]